MIKSPQFLFQAWLQPSTTNGEKIQCAFMTQMLLSSIGLEGFFFNKMKMFA